MISDPPRFFDDLCVRLGLCLEPSARSRITLTSYRDPDSLELAVLEAERLDPLRVSRQLRHDLRALIATYWEAGGN